MVSGLRFDASAPVRTDEAPVRTHTATQTHTCSRGLVVAAAVCLWVFTYICISF